MAEEIEAPRRPRRALLMGVAALYVLSLAAALVLVWRKGSERRELTPKGLLSLKKEDKVAWISIYGPIHYSEDGSPWKGGVDYWARKIKSLGEKEDVKAVVLEINSPGGTVASVQELHSQITKLRSEKKKPFVAFIGDVAASGGYYIASACDKVVAHPGSLTGSIGVIFQLGNIEGLFGKLGIKMEPIKSGKHKDIGSPTRAMTPEERRILQDLIDDAYGQFLKAVQDGRKMDLQKLAPLADGRIFTGRQALEAGLVDELGSSSDALRLATELGGIKGKPKVIRVSDPLEEILTFFESRLSLPRVWAGLPGGGFARLEYMWQFP